MSALLIVTPVSAVTTTVPDRSPVDHADRTDQALVGKITDSAADSAARVPRFEPTSVAPPTAPVDQVKASESGPGPSSDRAATATVRAVRAQPAPATPTAIDLRPPTSPDVGTSCADGLDAASLTEFFAGGFVGIGGADYQRALRLPDDRILWTFQDAFVGGRLIHNVGVVQSGRCFTRLGSGTDPWLLADATIPQQRWHWILDGVVTADGEHIELFVVEMRETGPHYLSRTRTEALRRVVLDIDTLDVVGVVDEPPVGTDLYGWSVTSDTEHTYLYSHCYQQFGYDTLLGFGECASDIKVARVDRGEPGGQRTYWDGTSWSADPAAAVAIVDATLFFAGNNPAQIRFDGVRFELVEKRGDWFGETVEFATADDPFGPFEPVASVAQPLPCAASHCNAYFATWVPWNQPDGTSTWMISHNRWNGAETADHLHHYRPSFHPIDLAP